MCFGAKTSKEEQNNPTYAQCAEQVQIIRLGIDWQCKVIAGAAVYRECFELFNHLKALDVCEIVEHLRSYIPNEQ